MINFLSLAVFLILGSTIYSFRDYHKYALTFYKMKFMIFHYNLGMLIANENTNEEFIIFSDWNFSISPKTFLQFDVWTLIDLHKLYWIVKFHKQAKNLGLLKKLGE